MLQSEAGPHALSGLDSHHGLEATAHSATDAITVPDSDLLFSGDYKRAGNDLILTDAKQKFVVHDYFLHDKHPTLLSPRGAALAPDIVLALAGPLAPGQYAQAGAPQPQAQAIGRVVTATGNVVAIRNGVSVTLHVGDALLKGDVLQTGSDSKLAVTFNDGATFDLGANARIVLTEFIYDPNGHSNASVVSLIRGQLSFIAGQVAHTGDMKVQTPVATMGIRGTVGIVSYGDSLTLTVADEHDGQIHSIAISDASGNVIGHATSVGGTWVVTSAGPQQANANETAREITPLQDLQVVQQLLTYQSLGQQLIKDLSTQATNAASGSSTSVTLNLQKETDTTIKVSVNSSSDQNGNDSNTSSTDKGGTGDQYFEFNNIITSISPPHFIDSPTVTRVQLAGLNSVGPAVSADGNVIVFFGATNLPGQNGDGPSAPYIYNRATNQVSSMTAQIAGTQLHNGESFDSIPSVSGDGHYVVFAGKYQQSLTLVDPSNASNIFKLGNSAHETFIYDSRTGITTLLSGNGDAPVISADGRFVAVVAAAYVWVSQPGGDSSPVQESVINVIDRTTGLTVDQIAIDATSSLSADAGVHDPALSADGRYLTFWTTASSIDINIKSQTDHFDLANTNGDAQIYRVDLSTPGAQPQLISGYNGAVGNGNSGSLFVSTGPSVTTLGNANYTFSSSDFNFQEQNGSILITSLPGQGTLFVGTHQLTAADLGVGGYNISLSDIDNGLLVFKPNASASLDQTGYGTFNFQALHADQTEAFASPMVVNVGHDDQWASSMSADGRFVVFESNATNLPGDTNGHSNIYLYDSLNNTVTRVSTDVANGSALDPTKFGDSLRPQISADGRYITYVSFATDLIQGGTTNAGGAAETYVYDRVTGQTTLVSGNNGQAANGDSQWGTSISGGGIFDAFGSTTTNLGGPSFVFTNVHSQASGSATTLTGLSVSDPNAAGSLTVTMTATDGTLTPVTNGSPPAGVTVTGSGTGTLKIQGSLTAINSALQTGLIYTPDSGSHTLTLLVTDPVGGTAQQSITVSAPGIVQGPTASTASILLSDSSHGTQGLVLDSQVPSVLTTSGITPFTDVGTHTVKAVALSGDWGTLTPVVSADTTGSNLGVVTWTYHVNEALAATLLAGSTHQDTFILYLTGSGGTTAEYVTVTTVGTAESPTVAWGAAPSPLTISVATSQGYNLDQVALSDLTTKMVNSVQTLNTHNFVNTAAGLNFQVSGTGLTYDASGHLNGGTITEIDIFDLSNNQIISETGFSLLATDFVNAVNSHDANLFGPAFDPTDPINETGSTGADHITGSNENGILIGGGGGDTLTAGNGTEILVSGPGGDGLPAANFNITITVTNSAPASTPTHPTGLYGTPIAVAIDPTLLAAIKADASLALTVTGIPTDATLSVNGVTLSPSADGRVTFTQAELQSATSLIFIAPQDDVGDHTLAMAGTTNEGGQFIGGAGADTFILGGHDGAETITNFDHAKGDVINLADIVKGYDPQGNPVYVSFQDVLDHATVGSDTVINFTGLNGLSTKVTLLGVSTLTEADFVFAQTALPDQTSTIITNSPIGTTFIESGAILLSNTDVTFASSPGAYGTLTQDLSGNSTHLSLNEASSPYTVISTSAGVVNTFTSVANATFEVGHDPTVSPPNYDFTVTNGTGYGANFGILKVDNHAALQLNGAVSSPGTVSVDAGGTLSLSAATLSGATLAFSGGQHSASGGGVLLSGATLLDSVANDNSELTLTIAASSGSLVPTSTAGLTIVGGFDGAAGKIEVTGTLGAIRTALDGGVTYLPGSNGQNTLSITLNGQSGAAFETLSIDTSDPTDPIVHTVAANGLGGTVDNAGVMDISDAVIAGGLDQIVIDNIGTIDVSGISAITDAAITNHAGGKIEVTGGTLTVDPTTVDNSGGTLQVDGGATLDLADTNISNGTVNVYGTLNSTGTSSIDRATVTDTGAIDVTAGTLTLDHDTVTNSGTVQVDAGATLTLSDTTITGGTITDGNLIDVTGDSTINGNAELDGGAVHVESATLTLDGVTVDGTALTEETTGSIIAIDGGDQLTLKGGASINDGKVTNDGTIEVADTATLSNDVVSNNQLTVDAGATLTLSDTTITGGTITDGNLIDVTGDSTLSNGELDISGAGQLNVSGSGNTLDHETVNIGNNGQTGGRIVIDGGQTPSTLFLSGDTITGGALVVGSARAQVSAGNNNSVLLSGLGIGDLNSTDNPAVTLTIVASNSALQELTGISSSDQTLNGNTLTVTGTLSDVSAALASGVTFTPADPNSSTTLTFSVADQGGDTAFKTLSIGSDLSLQLVDMSGRINNSGIIDITGNTTLSSDAIFNGQGTVIVEANKTLTFEHAGIGGGNVNVDGMIEVASNSTFNGATVNIGNNGQTGGRIVIDGGQTLFLAGTTVTGGALAINTPQAQSADASDTNVFLSSLALLDLNAGDGRTFTLTVTGTGGTVVQGQQSGSGGNTTFQASGSLSQISTALGSGITFAPESNGTNTLMFGLADDQGNILAFKLLNITTALGSAPIVEVADASGAIHNSGLVDIMGDATLTSDALFNDGTLKVESGHTLALNQTGIFGGTVTDLGAIDAANSRFGDAIVNLANDATLAVADGSALVLSGATINGGTINDGSSSAGANIIVKGSSAISGAALNYGQVTVSGGVTLTLDNGTVTGTTFADTANGATIAVDTGDTLTLTDVTINSGSVSNGGHITVESSLTLDGSVALNGTGIVTIDGATINAVNASLTNNGNTIIGTGQIGSGKPNTLQLNNASGTIEASGSGAVLDIATHSAVENAGTLQADSGAALKFHNGTIDNTGNINILSGGKLTIANPFSSGATLQLAGSGTLSLTGGTISGVMMTDGSTPTTETLVNDSTISGYGFIGTGSGSGIHLNINNDASGVIEASVSGQALTFKNYGNLINSGTLAAIAGATLQINVGAVTNSGAINISGDLELHNSSNNAVALNSTGTLSLLGGMVGSSVVGEILQNNGNTISGYGQIGDAAGNLVLDNESGTIEAAGSTLILNTGGNTITNAGTLEATNGGMLEIDSVVDNSGIISTSGAEVDFYDTVTNESGGTIKALDSGSVYFNSMAAVTNESGGTIQALGGGYVEFDYTVDNFGTISASGVDSSSTYTSEVDFYDTVTNESGGTIQALGGGYVEFDYTVGNFGTISASGVDSSSTYTSEVDFCDTVTNESGGTIKALDSGSVYFDGNVENFGIISASGADSSGASEVDFYYTITNESGGTIQADNGGQVVFELGSSVTNIAGGTLEATNGGTLTIHGSVDNSGTLEADGGTLVIASDAVISGINQTVDITAGGTAEFAGGPANQLDLNATFLGTAAGTLILDQPQFFRGEISGFLPTGDLLDLRGFSSAASDAFQTSAIYGSGTTLLTVTDTTQNTSASVTLVGDYSALAWSVSADGQGGAVVAPSSNFPSISTDNIALVTQDSFGGSGEHQGAAVTYADGHLYLSYNNGPEAQNTSDNADIVAFNTAPDGATQTFTYAWSYGDLFGIAADGSQIYAAGESYPGYGLTLDGVGGTETKSIFVRFDAGGTAGSDPSPAIGYTANNFFSYTGVESFSNVIATTQNGNSILYALGSGQPASYSGYIIAEYDSNGTLLHSAADSLASYSNPGGSNASDAVNWNGALWVVGYSQHPSLGDTHGHATVWTASYDLSSVVMHEDDTGVPAAFLGAAAIGSGLYAVGYADTAPGQQDYLIARYNTDGSVAWSETFGPSGTDTLNDAVAVDGRLFVVGSTTSGGTTEAVLMEINLLNGDVISTQTFDPAAYNAFTSVTTDGHYLYVAGVSGSSASSDQAVLLTYDIGGTMATTFEDTAVPLNSLSVSDAAAGSNQIEVTLAASHGTLALKSGSGLDNVVGAGTGSLELFGSIAAVNAVLASGVVYDPTLSYAGSDLLTITANDQGHAYGLALSTSQDVSVTITPADLVPASSSYEVTGPTGNTIAFAGSTGTLILDNPSTFTGVVAGISGNGDVINLKGFDAANDTITASTGGGSFDSITNTTTLTVTNQTSTVIETFKLAGDYSGSTWTVTSDGHGGANIVDPPATNSSSPSVVSSASDAGVNGSITFADANPSDTHTASFTPESPNYVGSFSLDAATTNGGSTSVGFQFSLGNDQINLASGQTLTQSYDVIVADAQHPLANTHQTVSVSLGGPGNDTFVFDANAHLGADTIINFNKAADIIEIDNSASITDQNSLLAALGSTGANSTHGDAIITLGHGDSVQVAGVTQDYLQQHYQNLIHVNGHALA